MRIISVFALIVAFVFACGSKEEGKTTSDSSSKKVAAAKAKKVDGAKIYKQYCVTCHGLYGDMGASGAHDLTGSILTLDERIQVITKGRNTMTPFESLLNEEKIKAVAEYTQTLKKE